MGRKHVVKEKLLVMSKFSFSHSVFKRLALQTCKNQDLYRKRLKGSKHSGKRRNCFFFFSPSVFKRLVLQTGKNKDLLRKGLKCIRKVFTYISIQLTQAPNQSKTSK